MIVITGAGGFIGSCLVARLNELNYSDLVLVDKWRPHKHKNIEGKAFRGLIDAVHLFDFIKNSWREIEIIVHLGARTDTTIQEQSIFKEWNLDYSRRLWDLCARFQIPFIYASSAATYGAGEHGYSDDPAFLPLLKPLNEYARSKHAFDLYCSFEAKEKPYYWIGLKFFNVYGPNEYHKGRMASVVFHGYHQIIKEGKMRLFLSHNPQYEHGEQKRDFIYVKDVVNVIYFFMEKRGIAGNGIYNVGTGVPTSFNTVAHSLFKALGIPPSIEFIPTPEDIRERYQYFTCADISRLRKAGYTHAFTSIEEGVADYVRNYLCVGKIW